MAQYFAQCSRMEIATHSAVRRTRRTQKRNLKKLYKRVILSQFDLTPTSSDSIVDF